MIASCHQGNLNDRRWVKRMKGDGKVAESIHQFFRISANQFMKGRILKPFSFKHFSPEVGKQLDLF